MAILFQRFAALGRRVVAGEQCIVGRVVSQNGFSDGHFMDFRRAIHHAQLRDVGPHSCQGRLVGTTQTAVQMHGPGDDL